VHFDVLAEIAGADSLDAREAIRPLSVGPKPLSAKRCSHGFG
jgi:hypothetical protein